MDRVAEISNSNRTFIVLNLHILYNMQTLRRNNKNNDHKERSKDRIRVDTSEQCIVREAMMDMPWKRDTTGVSFGMFPRRGEVV